MFCKTDHRHGRTSPCPSETHPCPACGKESIYTLTTDRFYHAWGDDNSACWVKLLKGEVERQNKGHCLGCDS